MSEVWRQSAAFGELRSLLQQAPSAQVWDALCTLLQTEAAEESAEEWFFYTERLLDFRWPDALRRVQPSWAYNPPKALGLCRALELRHAAVFRPTQLIKTLADTQLPLTVLRAAAWPLLPNADSVKLWGLLTPALRELDVLSTFNPPAQLLDMRALAQLQTLRLELPVRDGQLIKRLLQPGLLPALRRLSLRRVGSFGSDEASALITKLVVGEQLDALEELKLEELHVTSETLTLALERMAGGPLRSLTLAIYKDTSIADILDISKTAAQIERLTLSYNGCVVSLGSTLPNLHTLTISTNQFDMTDFSQLHAAQLPALRHLDLSGCLMEAETLEQLRAASWPDELILPTTPYQPGPGARVLGTIDSVLLGPPTFRQNNILPPHRPLIGARPNDQARQHDQRDLDHEERERQRRPQRRRSLDDDDE